MIRIKRCVLIMGLSAFGVQAFAWSDHASLVWPLLRTMPELLEPTLEFETLDSFVQAEASGLEEMLAQHERWATEHIEYYLERPAGLAFNKTAKDLRQALLEAIRVNPTLPYRGYRQLMVDDAVPKNVPTDLPAELLDWDDLSFLTVGSSHTTVAYLGLEEGDRVSPAHVLASGSDEPDFGLDIGLFSDSDGELGQRYGFGTQPFGDPKLEYGSQAPFHMGFYHLDWLTRKAQPDLLRTYPEWRVALFGELARFAFDTGHDYWGWRFSGWALHYIGDLSQPYHAQPLPGVSTAEALWLLVQGETAAAIQRVSNRHGVIESYQYQRVHTALEQKSWDDPVLRAIAQDGDTPLYDATTLRDALTRESVDAGEAVDAALESFVPSRYVSDPTFEWTGSGEETQIVASIEAEGGRASVEGMEQMLIEQMRRFSRYARAWVNATQTSAAP